MPYHFYQVKGEKTENSYGHNLGKEGNTRHEGSIKFGFKETDG